MSTKDTKNPCVGSCRFDAASECRGCRRTKAEVKGWKRLPDTEKAAINQRIRHRIRTDGVPETKRGGSKRLRKLDKRIRKLEARLGALQAERAALSGAAPPASPTP